MHVTPTEYRFYLQAMLSRPYEAVNTEPMISTADCEDNVIECLNLSNTLCNRSIGIED